MARVEEPSSQLEVIAAAYIYNLVLAFVGVAIVFTAVGLYDTFHSPFAASNIKTPIAVSNLIAFLLTYFASLSWRASERAIERGRNAPQPKGGFYRLLSLLFVPSMIVCGAFSLIFLAGLFHTFALRLCWRASSPTRYCCMFCFLNGALGPTMEAWCLVHVDDR
jgi:hypothetical protein